MNRIIAKIATIGALCIILSPAVARGTMRNVNEAIEHASAMTDTDPEKAISLTDSIRRHCKTNDAQPGRTSDSGGKCLVYLW